MTAGAAAAAAWRPTADWTRLQLRAHLLARVRAYFSDSGVLEVETPALVQAAVTDVHLESLRVVDDAIRGTTLGYLQTSPEYGMKRLLCAGAPDIYQVCKVFRAGERGGRHNPEFTMLEWYRHGLDHHALMRDVEALVRHVLEPVRTFAASDSIAYCAAFERRLGLDPLHAPVDAILQAIEHAGTSVPDSMRAGAERDDALDLAMGTVVAESFATDRLTFLYDFPASQAALAQIRGEVASRFEAFWGPLELANGFHELGSAPEQAARFEADLARRRDHGQPVREVDGFFLEALAAGLPPCAGVALGFDRLVMVAAQAGRIDDVLAFPYERA